METKTLQGGPQDGGEILLDDKICDVIYTGRAPDEARAFVYYARKPYTHTSVEYTLTSKGFYRFSRYLEVES